MPSQLLRVQLILPKLNTFRYSFSYFMLPFYQSI